MPSCNNPFRLISTASFTIALLFMWQFSYAGPLRDRIIKCCSSQQTMNIKNGKPFARELLPAGVRLLRDVPYGKDILQRMDIYLPRQTAGAPVIFMIHGGAWRIGDKGAKAVVKNKVARWVPKGFIFISVNYRLLPGTLPLEQAHDIANALVTAQTKAASWGGDPEKFIMMGHSAGAHLAALVTASPGMVLNLGAKPWLGAVLLDSPAFDIVKIMEVKHARLYDRAFGSDPAYWKAASPFHNISKIAAAFLAVCSIQRNYSCLQSRRFVTKAASLNVRASTLEQDLSHRDINQYLGVEGHYTDAVESFMGTLDESVMRILTNRSERSR